MSIPLPISMTIDEPLFRRLYEHLFPGDGDEHGAVIVAGIAKTKTGTRLLAREVFPAEDGIDYVPGTRGYRALTARFVAEMSGYCAEENLCYLAVHCHGGDDSVGFSGDDLASHERGYPALLDITNGMPVGALVFARNAVAGEIWTPEGRFDLNHLRIVGRQIRNLYSSPRASAARASRTYDRQTRLFGKQGQQILKNLKIGIIGLGGGGSLLNEWLAKLGVGEIVAVDFDRVDISNLPRIVGATRWDARTLLTNSRWPLLQKLGKRFAAYKVHVARRVARKANPAIRYQSIVGDLLNESVAMQLRDADFLFLASDSIQSRLVFNAVVQQYLIPGAQIGAKVSADKNTGVITDIFSATRLVLPGAGCGCLDCAGAIPASRLNDEAKSERERKAQRYVDDPEIHEPSVITLNALSAAPAANDLMMLFTGLFEPGADLTHMLNFARERKLEHISPRVNDKCLDCGSSKRSRRARGDTVRLPCRMG